ncbi:MAG: hypothetical protein IPP97_15315 [Candidatus Obscuribacter sp.]|nr:hypothetical protein [Candidatus Obscuribacter sp.]
MKDPRDKTNDKSIAAKADHIESSGHSSGDSTGSGSAVEKSIKGHQRTEVKPVLTSNPIAQVFEQVTKAVDKAQQDAGDLTNAAINAVTHNDLGKQFADNVSPELASDYQKGKALIAQRLSQGHALTDMSGLNKEQKRQVEAYQKLHSELPAKIPFYNQEALSRQIDQALSQKTKSVPPSTVATARVTPGQQAQATRNSTNSPGVAVPRAAVPGVAKDAPRLQTRSSDAKSDARSGEAKAVPARSTEVKASEAKAAETRAAGVNSRSSVSEQSPQPKAVAPLKSNSDLTDTKDKNSEVKNTDKTQQKFSSTPTSNTEAPPPNKTYPSKNEGRAPANDDRQAPHRDNNQGLRPESKAGYQAQQSNGPKIEPDRLQRAEVKPETKTEIKTENRSLPNTKVGVDNAAVTKTGAIESRTAPHNSSTAKIDSNVLVDKPKLEGPERRDPIGQVLKQTIDATGQSEQRTIKSAEARVAIYSKDSPLYLDIIQYRTFDRLIKNNLLPLTHTLDAGVAAPRAIVLSPSGGRALFVHTKPLLPHALPHADAQMPSQNNSIDGASRAHTNTTYVSKPVESNAEHSNKDFGSASEANHPTVVQPAIKSTEQVAPSKSPLVQDLSNSIGTINDTAAKRSALSGGQTTSDTAIRTNRDLKYITGAELVFAVIVAVAGTARARGPEQQIEPVRLEAPLADNGADSNVIASADDVALLVMDKVSLATVVRPQVIVALGDTLTEIAARLYGDTNLAWLIAALNPQCQYHYHKDRCLVRLKVRQVLSLPVFDDLKTFARQRKSYMVAANILTVVEDTAVNKEVLNQTFAALLGLGSLSSDPLQKNKRAEA